MAWFRAWWPVVLRATSGFAFCVGVLVSAGLLLAELGGFGLLWTLAAAVRGPGLETP